jgi:protein-serine/threonine kinase
VDIWACGIVYYCLHFQELPWRVAQSSDPLYVAYASACASPQADKAACPQTIGLLSPRSCRSLIRKMLEPDPKQRYTIDDVIKHSWLESVEVCHTAAKPNHVHVHARALAKAQIQVMGVNE